MTTSFIAKLLICLSISAGAAQLPPNSARINGNQWTIRSFELNTDFPNLDGYTNCSSHTIYWRTPQYGTLQTIIWHELLHAGTCFGTIPDSHYWDSPNAKQHVGIYRLSIYISELLRDNPELARWLIGGSK